MELRLGRHSFDVTNRPLVAAVFSGSAVGEPSEIRAVLAQRPHMVEVVAMDAAAAPNGAASLVADISTSFDGPVSIRTDEAAVAAAALAAGACTAHDPSGAVNPAYLAVVQAHGASLIIGVPPDTVGVAEFIRTRASSAEAAGIDPAGIVFHAREPSPSAIAGLRWAVCVEEGPPGWGQAVRAVMVGARLVFADATDGNIRSIRRTVFTAAELLARRAAAPGAPVATPATSEPPRQ